MSKVSNVFQGGPLVEYASPYGLETFPIYLFSFFSFKNKLVLFKNKKIVSGFIKILLIGYVVGFIVNPILIMSKARTLTMLLSLTLIFIFLYLKNKLMLIILASIVCGHIFVFILVVQLIMFLTHLILLLLDFKIH